MKLNIFGTVNRYSGIGHHVRQFAKALNKFQEIVIYPTDSGAGAAEEDPELAGLVGSGEYDSRLPQLVMGYGPGISGFAGSFRIGYLLFEYTRIPKGWLHSYQEMDRLLVPSQWGRQVLISNRLISDRISVVHGGFDPQLFHLSEETLPTMPFRFISVGKWERRKGLFELVQAFQIAFGRSPDVELWILTHAGDQTPSRLASDFDALRLADFPNIRLLQPCESDYDVARFYQQGHVFVLPSRCEGWGLPILEAMASGIPVITTGFGAHSTFATPETAMILPLERLEPIDDPVWFSPAENWGYWLKLEVGVIAAALCEARRDYAALKARALEVGPQIHQRFTWEAAAKAFVGLGLI